jgi:uncharacterized protein (TIGR02391 family)
MQTLKNNRIIEQLRILLSSAMTLKEKFDTGQSHEVLEAFLQIYTRDLDVLVQLCPSEVIKKGNLLRHSAFLERYLRQGQPSSCYSDVKDICFNDIFYIEECYLHYLSDTSSVSEKYFDWQNIHTIIQRIAKPRFESYHFADAVEASFKELNDIIKRAYLQKTNEEEDGDRLMRRAFTTSNNNNFAPLFRLADNDNESGRNIQQGYMDIFAGCMKGIRNPKAHANLDINPDEAWEMIVIASHLMRMWEKHNMPNS